MCCVDCSSESQFSLSCDKNSVGSCLVTANSCVKVILDYMHFFND